MSTEEENYSKIPLIVAKVSLILAIVALGVTVLLAIPILRKSYSSTPTTPVIPVTPSDTQFLPSLPRKLIAIQITSLRFVSGLSPRQSQPTTYSHPF